MFTGLFNIGVRNFESVTETRREFISSSTAEKVALWVAARSGGVKALRLLWSPRAAAMISDGRSKYRHDAERDFGRELPPIYPRYICGIASARARAYACACCKYVRSVVSMGHERNFQLSITVVILPEH